MSKPEMYYRNIILSENITSESVKSVLETIMQINWDDEQKEADYKDWERKPIKLFINSFGGSVYDGLSLVDVIKQSKTPVHTISIGILAAYCLLYHSLRDDHHIHKFHMQ